MQLVAENLSCPLCKRPLAEESTPSGPGSRLCESCQAMIHGALRVRVAGEKSGVAVIAPSEIPAVIEEAALDEPRLEFYEGPADNHSFDASSAPMLEFNDDREPAASENEIAEINTMTRVPTESPLPGTQSIDDESVKSVDQPHDEDAGVIQAESTDVNGEIADEVQPLSRNSPDDHGEEHDSADASVDPWENPLPEWEYSKNEWPVLVGPGRQSHKQKSRVVIAGLVGAIIVIAAGAYFITHRSNAVATSSPAAERAAAPNDDSESSEAIVVPSPQSQVSEQSTQGVNNARSSEREATPASETDNSSGRFSLQAAAFPNQEGAAEFADKLKRAGVPSYVVVADIPKRGRWYRVRVGRFNSAAEAQRFASEAQTRAAAAGLSLQLIGCQYERPE